jgi:hypothetical protein
MEIMSGVSAPLVYESTHQSPKFGDGRGFNGFIEPMLQDPVASYDTGTFVNEMDLRTLSPMPPMPASCSLQELNIAIQGVMQTIEEERAVRANETSDLRREVYQAIYQERDSYSKELNEMKSEVSTQHGWFMKEIIRRSVYEARLQNEVDQISKDPHELTERFASIESQIELLRAAMEPLRAATEEVLAKAKPQLGPEVLSDPRLVELLVASTDSTLKMMQENLHELVGQKIEEHLGKIDDSSSLFGMVREALSTSRLLKDEMGQVKEVLGQNCQHASMPVLETLTSREAIAMTGFKGQAHPRPVHSIEVRPGLTANRFEGSSFK